MQSKVELGFNVYVTIIPACRKVANKRLIHKHIEATKLCRVPKSAANEIRDIILQALLSKTQGDTL